MTFISEAFTSGDFDCGIEGDIKHCYFTLVKLHTYPKLSSLIEVGQTL